MKYQFKSLVGICCVMMMTLKIVGQNKPNIIYILADDLGYGDVSAYNPESKIKTPNIDALANNGIKFTDAHTNSSVCTPTRYGILTGRYAWRTHLKKGVLGGHSNLLIDVKRETVASYLKDKGYSTGCIGKWHLGMDWPTTDGDIAKRNGLNVDLETAVKNGPLEVGFDYFYGISGSLNMNPHAYMEQDKLQGHFIYAKTYKDLDSLGLVGAKPGWVEKTFKQNDVLRTLTHKTIDWIKDQDRKKPFFVYLPLNAPHSPIVPAPEFQGQSKLLPHGDFCLEVDFRVGEIVKALKALDIEDNTMIIFTSDNGASPKTEFKKMQELGHYSSYKYRGIKGSIYEAGHRVPFVVKWPKQIKKSLESDRLMCTTDLFATVADVLEDKLPDHIAEDSYSFNSILKGNIENDKVRGGIVHHSDNGFFAIRDGKWKLVFTHDAGSRRKDPKDKPIIGNPADLQLFDMENDPYETMNVQAENPKVVLHLKQLMKQYVDDGRSTKGKVQKNDVFSGEWEQRGVFE